MNEPKCQVKYTAERNGWPCTHYSGLMPISEVWPYIENVLLAHPELKHVEVVVYEEDDDENHD